MRTELASSVLLLAASASTQGSFTVPKGYDSVDGFASVSYPFGSPAFRYQECHTSWVGTARAGLKSIAFRRDAASATNAAAVARTADVTLYLGHGNHATFSSTFANNYDTAGPQIVFVRKSVSLPDWTQKPIVSPDAWTVVLPFDLKFTYNGLEDFVWEIVVENNTGGSTYPADRSSSSGAASVSSLGTTIGTGCKTTSLAPSFAMTCTESSYVRVMKLVIAATGAPPSMPVVAFLGLSDPNLALPGFCAAIHSSLEVSIPAGVAIGSGTLGASTLWLPYTPAFAGAYLYEQMAAIDASQPGVPVALSNGIAQQIATGPAPGPFAYTYSAMITSTTGINPSVAGSVITRFEY